MVFIGACGFVAIVIGAFTNYTPLVLSGAGAIGFDLVLEFSNLKKELWNEGTKIATQIQEVMHRLQEIRDKLHS